VVDSIRARYGLDRSIFEQYTTFQRRTFTLDFGESFQSREPIGAALRSRMGVSTFIIGSSFLITVVVGVGLGVLAGLRSGGRLDRGLNMASVVFASLPSFVLGVFLLQLFAVRLGWLPVIGTWSNPLEAVRGLALPILTLSLAGVAAMLKLTRVAVIDGKERDHIWFARARGLGRRDINLNHLLRNALVTTITTAGVILVGLLSAVALVEIVFNLDGVGSYLLRGVQTQDLPVIQAGTIMVTALILVINVVIDGLYRIIDPRLRQNLRSVKA
jgi:peptide/nickel transport system permease protein